MWRSVLQTAHAETSIRTWLSAGTGSGSSRSTSVCPGRSRTIALTSVGLDDLVESRPLGRGPPGSTGGVDQLLGLEADAVLRAGHPRDVLLHQRAAEVIDAPAQALRRRIEPHLHPARLEIRDRLAEGEPEGGRVLEVVGARDLLHPMRTAEQRVERYEAERDELRDPAGPLLQPAHHAHVTGELARLLDVTEHHRLGGPQPSPVGCLDDLDPARRRQSVRRDPLANAVVEH